MADEHSLSDWSDEIQRRWLLLSGEIRRRIGAGIPLDPDTRARMEARFGQPLDMVLVHRGPLAGPVTTALGADAFSAGPHVVGDTARLDPSTAGGQGLYAHELTHVVHAVHQQPTTAPASPTGLMVQRAPLEGSPPSGEAEARAAEEAAAASPEAAAQQGAKEIDVERLADLVYRRFVAEVQEFGSQPWR